MASGKRGKKGKSKYTSKGALLKNGIYAVKATMPKKARKKASTSPYIGDVKATGAAIDRGKKMALIEAYAKENQVTIAQAMIHFMEQE
jgi:hypothetical protein